MSLSDTAANSGCVVPPPIVAPGKRRLLGENLQRGSAALICTGSGAELGRRADDAIMTTQNTSSSDNILDHGACLSAINQTRRDVSLN